MNVAAHKSGGQHASCFVSFKKDCHYYICSCELPALLGDEAIPALLDVVVARLLFSPLFRGDERLDVALLRFLVFARGDRRGRLVVLPAPDVPQGRVTWRVLKRSRTLD